MSLQRIHIVISRRSGKAPLGQPVTALNQLKALLVAFLLFVVMGIVLAAALIAGSILLYMILVFLVLVIGTTVLRAVLRDRKHTGRRGYE